MAVPLSGFTPIAIGIFLPVGSAGITEVTVPAARSMIAMEQPVQVPALLVLPLFATSAIFRRLSTATLAGEDAAHGAEPPAVQIEAKTVAPVATLMTVMLFEPRFATTATPVAVLIAT